MKIKLLLLTFLSCFISTTYAQIKITGVVLDTQDEPIIGATVIVKGTSVGCVTLLDGTFTLNMQSIDNALLVASCTGYQSVELPPASQSNMKIVLKDDYVDLEDVVVVGYGVSRRSDLTGSIAAIGEKELADRSAPSVEEMMKGVLAGVNITSSDGAPGGGISIQVRGIGTITGSTEPLYVIDGVPVNSDSLEDGYLGATTNNPMSGLNPNDISSIQVLKDASATAIYGARAANGVILITTKQGEAGKPKVSFSARFGVSQMPNERKYDMMNSSEYVHYRSLRQPGEAQFDDWQSWENKTNTDWQDAMMQTGKVQDYQFGVSGGNNNSKYLINLGYYNEEGILISTAFERYTANLKFTNKLTDKATLTNSLFASRVIQDGMFAGIVGEGLITTILKYTPYTALYDVDGELNTNEDADPTDQMQVNPYIQALETEKLMTNTAVRYSGTLNWKLTKNIEWMARPGIDYRLVEQDYYWPTSSNKGLAGTAGENGGYARKSKNDALHWVLDNVLTYKETFNKRHKVDFMVGYSMESTHSQSFAAEAYDFPIGYLTYNYLGAALENTNTTSSVANHSLVSAFGRLNYHLDDKYLFTGSLRADASSNFSGANKWGYFPSFAFKWRAKQEDFLKSVKQISDLSVRVSAGATGNQAIANYSTLSSSTSELMPFDDDLQLALVYGRMENPDLKWETTLQYDAGVDMGLFNNRLYVTADLYLKQTKDMLMNCPVARYTGYVSRMENIGAVENKGLELTIKGVPFDGAFKWDTQFNISFNKNKVTQLNSDYIILDPRYDSNTTDETILQVGAPIGQWYGYVTEGIWSSWEEIIASGITDSRGSVLTIVDGKPVAYVSSSQNYLTPGMVKYKDLNDDGVIDSKDRTVLGCGLPDFTGAFSNYFSYKGAFLNCVFTYSYGNENLNANLITLTDTHSMSNKISDLAFNFSTSDGDTYTIKDYANPLYETNNGVTSDYVEDASFIRLSTVTVGYDFHRFSKKLAKYGIRSFKLYLTANNLYVWTKYSGYDPEVSTGQSFETGGTSKYICPGLDYGSYPKSRTISMGANVVF